MPIYKYQLNKKVVKPKTGLRKLRSAVISAFVMLALFLVAGTGYVYYIDNHEKPVPKNTSQKVESAQTPSLPKPVKPGANAPVGVAIESISSPIKAGENSSVNILTNAGSKCTIDVEYDGKPSKGSGLESKIANDYGVVEWTWTVASSTQVGNWPVKITCFYNGKSGVGQTNIQVTR